MYSNKDFHLTFSTLLHYLVKVEDSKTPPILVSYRMYSVAVILLIKCHDSGKLEPI